MENNIEIQKRDPMDYLLECWIKYQFVDDKDLGVRTTTLPLGKGDGYGSDEDDSIYAREENRLAKSVDVCIHDLPHLERWAILKMCGVSKVWPHAQINYETMRTHACDNLRSKLKKNRDTWHIFDV